MRKSQLCWKKGAEPDMLRCRLSRVYRQGLGVYTCQPSRAMQHKQCEPRSTVRAAHASTVCERLTCRSIPVRKVPAHAHQASYLLFSLGCRAWSAGTYT